MSKFSPNADYKTVLNRLKNDFEKKWKEKKSSDAEQLKEYEDIRVLGSGAFGVVKLVKHKTSGKYFAMKYLSKEKVVKNKQIAHTLLEKQVLKCIDFPFLVSLEHAFKDNTTLYLLLPFVNGGDMFSVLRKYGKFSESHARFYAAQVVLAFEYLHHLNLIYRDLKPENILIDHLGYLKITDFGFCKMVETRTYTLCGTPEYLAPEIIQSKGYGKAVDWWSFGILLYEMIAGYSPFYTNNPDPMALFDKIVSGKYRFTSAFTSESKSLVTNLLQTDITRRYGNLKNGVQDIKGHIFFKPTKWIALLNREETAPYVPKISGEGDYSNFDACKDDIQPKIRSKCQYEKDFLDF
ncbi:cAMP-dependent protein kinase catalytic subunit alpha-like [Culicoides brevitarsis]|uniref:cAMP-dependent protein kinase catalytic subunit alpha-like n=1 Tax=Culicoides brevitarsis TaxID=469753 RepID=UPI00307B3A58